jgi:hypothetical protein
MECEGWDVQPSALHPHSWPNKGDALGRGAVHVFRLRRMLELRAVHRLWRRPAPVIATVSPFFAPSRLSSIMTRLPFRWTLAEQPQLGSLLLVRTILKGLRTMQEQLAAVNLAPMEIAASGRPKVLVDFVYGGWNSGRLLGLLEHWAGEIGVGSWPMSGSSRAGRVCRWSSGTPAPNRCVNALLPTVQGETVVNGWSRGTAALVPRGRGPDAGEQRALRGSGGQRGHRYPCRRHPKRD